MWFVLACVLPCELVEAASHIQTPHLHRTRARTSTSRSSGIRVVVEVAVIVVIVGLIFPHSASHSTQPSVSRSSSHLNSDATYSTVVCSLLVTLLHKLTRYSTVCEIESAHA